jgi:lactobin A/cerein 7B family class IIb bacteriocin
LGDVSFLIIKVYGEFMSLLELSKKELEAVSGGISLLAGVGAGGAMGGCVIGAGIAVFNYKRDGEEINIASAIGSYLSYGFIGMTMAMTIAIAALHWHGAVPANAPAQLRPVEVNVYSERENRLNR